MSLNLQKYFYFNDWKFQLQPEKLGSDPDGFGSGFSH